MKKIILLISLVSFCGFSQEHFSGINTSKRIGLLNSTVNPAELGNMFRKYDVTIFNMSQIVSNNKIGFSDLNSDVAFEDLIFEGTTPTDARIDLLIQGPSFAMKYNKWGFAVNTAANVKINAINVDPVFGRAVTKSFEGIENINFNENQRLNAATWGEIGVSAARTLFENEKHKFNSGLTLKLLFPGSYMNMGIQNLNGIVTNDPITEDVYLGDASALINFQYSGSLANSYQDQSNYSGFFAGGLNGFGADFGFNYQLKENFNNSVNGVINSSSEYKLNAGLSVRNIGAMTFNDNNNQNNTYALNIPASNPLNLDVFEDSESVIEIEQVLIDRGVLSKLDGEKDFKVKLPTILNAYLDYKIYKKWHISAYTQQKLTNDNENNVTTSQNIVTITPRFGGKNYELYLPVSNNEISGFSTGFGFRLGGFFMGSSSAITTALGNSKQADFYMGFRFAI